MSDPTNRRNFRAIEFPQTRDNLAGAIDDELRFHLDERVAELMSIGLDEPTARAKALTEFGNIEGARVELERIDAQALRRSVVTELIGNFGADVKQTIRALGKRPGFSIVAALTLALGIGANAAMFGLVDRLLLSAPPHIKDAEGVLRLSYRHLQHQSGEVTWERAPFAVYESLKQLGTPFAQVAAFSDARPLTGVGENAHELNVFTVSNSYFDLLGPVPVRGRFWRSNEQQDVHSVVISYGLWQRTFGADADVVGRDLRLNGTPFRIIGVAPAGFTGTQLAVVDAWVPLGTPGPGFNSSALADRNYQTVTLLARLRPGVTSAQASTQASIRYRGSTTGTTLADTTSRVLFSGLIPGRENAEGTITPDAKVALWLQGVSLMVLLIALANVSNLLLLRAIERQRDTAVRLAMGIGRIRLLRHVALESAILAIAGGIGALLLARFATPALWAVLVPGGTPDALALGKIVRVTAAIVVASIVLVTALPSLLQWKMSVTAVLRERTRGVTRGRSLVGDSLVVLQVMLTVTLLVGAGLFVTSLVNASATDMGFAVNKTVVAQIDPERATISEAEREAFVRNAHDRVRQLPGVEAVGLSQSVPYRPSLNTWIGLPGHEKLPGVGPKGLGYPTFFTVTPEFFQALGLRLLSGRRFTEGDVAGASRVMIVDATMARTFWPATDAVGQCVKLGADTMPCTTVVGVIQDSRRTIAGDQHSLRYYLPLAQSPFPITQRFLYARTSGSPEALVSMIKSQIAESHPSAPFADVYPMGKLLDWQTRQWRLGAAVFVVFGILSVVIATLGLYGVVAFDAARQRRELAVRRALGATQHNLVSLVMRGALRRTLIGVSLGSIVAATFGRQLNELLFKASTSDVDIYVMVVGTILLATAVASAMPAWRVARIDPAIPLKAE